MSHHPLSKPSDRAAVLGVINPQSATTAKSTSWVLVSAYGALLAKIFVGTIASTGTVDAKIEQATTSGGGSAKDLSGAAITQLTQAGTDSDKQAMINVNVAEMDGANGFVYARLTITPATAAALICGELEGWDPNFPVSHAATVDEVVAP